MHRSSQAIAQKVLPDFDLFVVGGGINGVGVALDAVGRGLKVGLCEMGDLAGATSSSSSKLIHGGLRYLEHYEFRLVKESLAEREVLLRMAPHIARPMRFCLPHRPQLRPAWMIRAGLFLYDHLSSRTTLPGCKNVQFDERSPLISSFNRGFEYSDAWVDDARLVVLNAISLRERGGDVFVRTKACSAIRENGYWRVVLQNQITGEERTITARVLVNATGPWVTDFIKDGVQQKSSRRIRLIKGSHIVVRKLHDEDRAYILQNDDQRIVFVIPYLDQFSLIGTTDVEYKGDPSEVGCSEQEIEYLCAVVNRHYQKKINSEDIIWTYSGVRPLCEDESSDPQAVTRDYTFEVDDAEGEAPLLSIFGGKLTTYRKLAEHAMDSIAGYFSEIGSAWTASSRLPGAQDVGQCATQLKQQYDWLPDSLIQRFSTCYGSLAFHILAQCESVSDMGEYFGGGLYQVEVDYLIRDEWVHTVEDLIWRRSKLGLFLNEVEQKKLSVYISQWV
ncbi:glycerol-3-phosphate dehydrogenase [Endozoicomonas sp. (ex Bugula neritina AB1)]|nr:glycerol-3-phosphate dehydrogenase [Endozoicomonas sp. (ex Bugula neritina AB1)]